MGIVKQAKGSAYIEIGQKKENASEEENQVTKVLCSVFDPKEGPNKNNYSEQGHLFCHFKFAPFSCKKRKIHQQDSEEKLFSLVMQRALEPAVCRVQFD